ncbi:MAG: LacI family DNA-binding transcriptional regulator [Verrucomicrobiae bacterium]|nr:LacI family DNA-binding transcriptional regulator [Verrucomicrobiae bacterium]
MSVTISQIAREANVSIGTVSKALNNRDGVSEELRERIKGIAQRLQYFPYIKSRENGMMVREANQIAVVFGRNGGHILDGIQHGIDAALADSGFREVRLTVQIDDMVQESSKKFILDKILNDPQICGAIFVFLPLTDADIARFKRGNIHITQINNFSTFGLSVTVDDFGAAYEATEQLIKFGHQCVGFVLPNDAVDQVWRDRLAGYKKAIADHNLAYDGSWIANESAFDPHRAGLVTYELLLNNPSMTAILYGCDQQAMGGLKMLREMHLRVPEDVAVVGFDDMAACELINPPLASVRLPLFEMGKQGTEMLLEAIQTKAFKNEKRLLKARLVLRRSADMVIPQTTWLPESSPLAQMRIRPAAE